MKQLILLSFIISFLICSCTSKEKTHLQLADKKASLQTVELFLKMQELKEKGILIGHQDDLAYGVKWKAPRGKSDIYDVCNDYPAVFGWDLCGLEYESPFNIDSVPFDFMAKSAVEFHKRGAVNTFSWHCNNPLTGGNAWDNKSNDVVKNILPGGSKNDLFNRWLDRIAVFLSSLKDSTGKCIPVIFRPFHEQSGSWFWWGKDQCTSIEFIQLWQYTIRYLTEEKDLHNLIFAFSTDGTFGNSSCYSDRYPGNDFVDIVGFDIYQGKEQSNQDFSKMLSSGLTMVCDFARENNKLPAITEIGYEQIPYINWWTEVLFPSVKNYRISYALFWRNAINRPNHYFVPYPGQISEADFKKFYSFPVSLFLKDI